MNIKNTISPIFFALALALGVSACSSDLGGGGGAFLTISGDANLQLEPGFQRDLVVRYHDAQGNALTGDVTFEVLGELKGSRLDSSTASADGSGDAKMILFLGQDETVFRIKASAPAATSVEWTVSVTEGMVAEDMDIRGTYDVDSAFDVANGLPGTVGNVVNEIIDMTDSPNDPATYIIDAFDSGDAIPASFRAAVDAVVLDLINDYAPSFVLDLIKLGDQFGQVTKNFGVISTIEITGDTIEGTNMKAKHTITAYKFDLDGEEFIFTLDELNEDDVVISDIPVEYDNRTGLAKFAQHEVSLQYGAFLVLLLEEVIIPKLDDNARTLNQYLFNSIDCVAIGQGVFDNVDFGTPDQFKRACEIAVEAVASAIIKQLRDLDEGQGVSLKIDGKTRMRDPSGDKKADKMTRGNWGGTMDYLGTSGPLADGANPFTGERNGVN